MTTDTLREAVARALEPKCYGLGDTKRLMSLELTDAALSAIEAAGWRIVPADATADMTAPAVRHALSINLGHEYTWPQYMFDLYRIMTAAAPRLDATVRSGEEG